jgi:hypothetical protein
MSIRRPDMSIVTGGQMLDYILIVKARGRGEGAVEFVVSSRRETSNPGTTVERYCDMKNPRYLVALGVVLALLSPASQASFLHGDTLDTVAKWLALFIIFFVPIGGIWLFWLIHILPEKVAEKRHHPQKDAIKTLCLLSLVFGGLLWPFAWLWAYTKPVTYKLAYGTEKHTDYFLEAGEKAMKQQMTLEEIRALREELDQLEKKGHLTTELQQVRDQLVASEVALLAAAEGAH